MEQNGFVGKISNLYEGYTRILDLLRNPVLLALRLFWGWQFFLTGKGKLMNLDQTAAFFADLNLPLPKLSAVMAASTECFGGLLLLVGLGSRFAGLALTATMTVAYFTAHTDELMNAFSNPDGFLTADPFLFLLASLIVTVCGPGIFSLDALICKLFKRSDAGAPSPAAGAQATES